MPNPNRKRGLLKRVFLALMIPGRSLFGALVELWDGLKDLGIFRVPFLGRGRRNRQFAKAGQEPRGPRRRASGAVFRKGERERKRELLEAERENRKYLSGNSAEAVEYREQLEQRNVEFSRGETVNHLAKVNAKIRQGKKKTDADAADSDPKE